MSNKVRNQLGRIAVTAAAAAAIAGLSGVAGTVMGSTVAEPGGDMHWSVTADAACPADMHWSDALGVCTADMHW